jgi:hypothetical protein
MTATCSGYCRPQPCTYSGTWHPASLSAVTWCKGWLWLTLCRVDLRHTWHGLYVKVNTGSVSLSCSIHNLDILHVRFTKLGTLCTCCVQAAAKERMQLPEPPGAPKWRVGIHAMSVVPCHLLLVHVLLLFHATWAAHPVSTWDLTPPPPPRATFLLPHDRAGDLHTPCSPAQVPGLW